MSDPVPLRVLRSVPTLSKGGDPCPVCPFLSQPSSFCSSARLWSLNTPGRADTSRPLAEWRRSSRRSPSRRRPPNGALASCNCVRRTAAPAGCRPIIRTVPMHGYYYFRPYNHTHRSSRLPPASGAKTLALPMRIGCSDRFMCNTTRSERLVPSSPRCRANRARSVFHPASEKDCRRSLGASRRGTFRCVAGRSRREDRRCRTA